MYRVYSTRIQNFLGEHKCLPKYEMNGVAYYLPTYKFLLLLEKYEIQKAMRNKL